ncbi:hypothetical protein A2335_02830, partial [Candidatus Peregrinibacteria bacterium RIFOXYB2_FULL_32_7]
MDAQNINFKPQYIPRQKKVILISILIIIAILLTVFYTLTSRNLKHLLRENLISMAYLGSLQINGDYLEKINIEEDMYTEEFKMISDQLNQIRKVHAGIRYAYTMRKTDKPDTVKFVVDADNYLTVEKIDRNGNGIIDPKEELPIPGEEYNYSHAPQLGEGFSVPTADYEINHDQWGDWLSAYAPIKNSKGETVGILGIDMTAKNVKEVLNSMQRAIAMLVVLILAIASSFYSIIIVKEKELMLSEEANIIKSTFLTKISHELRTPIVAIAGFVELIMDTNKDLPKDMKSHLESIKI